MRPQLWVVGGPNGAGKSTIVERYGDNRLTVINPDIYARDLSAALDDTARIAAAAGLRSAHAKRRWRRVVRSSSRRR